MEKLIGTKSELIKQILDLNFGDDDFPFEDAETGEIYDSYWKEILRRGY